jgi:hypothetical protein
MFLFLNAQSYAISVFPRAFIEGNLQKSLYAALARQRAGRFIFYGFLQKNATFASRTAFVIGNFNEKKADHLNSIFVNLQKLKIVK